MTRTSIPAASLVIATLLAIGGCSSITTTSELAVPEGAGGHSCVPVGEEGAVLVASDILTNVGSSSAQVVSVEPVSPDNLEIANFATVLDSEDGFRGDSNGTTYPIDLDGQTNPVPRDESVTIQALLRLTDPSRDGTADALRVSYRDADDTGSTQTVDTAFELRFVPAGTQCF